MSMTKRHYWEEIIADQSDDTDCPDAPEPKKIENKPMDRLLAAFRRGHFDVTAAEIFDEPTDV
jgi:hypothetical protein